MTFNNEKPVLTIIGHSKRHNNIIFYFSNIVAKNAFMPVMTFERLYFFAFLMAEFFLMKKYDHQKKIIPNLT